MRRVFCTRWGRERVVSVGVISLNSSASSMIVRNVSFVMSVSDSRAAEAGFIIAPFTAH
jgi:hypothetical protein